MAATELIVCFSVLAVVLTFMLVILYALLDIGQQLSRMETKLGHLMKGGNYDK